MKKKYIQEQRPVLSIQKVNTKTGLNVNKKVGFTLIELIVGITISMLLMVSIGVFINNGMKNIFDGQKVLENTDNFINFSEKLNKSISLIESGSFIPTKTSSGVLFKRGLNFSEGGFSYIGTQILDKIYCESGAESTQTNNIYIKNFIPFEENSENIFTNYNDILTAKLGNYTSFQKENVVEDNGVAVVGKGVFGNKFVEGSNGTDIYLNSPTGLASDGTNLYISDTLNNRIIYLDSSNKIHLLLDENDGLNEPTGLYYKDNTLYISNSGNGEILEYSSKSTITNNTLSISGINTNNVDKFEISFYNQDSTNRNISGPTDKTDINFSNITKDHDYLGITNNLLEYHFVKYIGAPYNEPNCLGAGEILVSGKPVKCLNSGSGQTSTYQTKNFNKTNIDISSITSNFSSTGSYYVNLKLLNSSNNILYQDYFPYFTQSDNDLTTKNDNTLKILYSGLNYPTGIWGTGATEFNEFIDGSYSNLAYDNYDSILDVPIKSLDVTNDPINNLLTVILKYYKSYNCYNTDEKVERTFIAKKSLK